MNHVIDPSFFYDAIDMYSFEYDAFIVTGMSVNEYGIQKPCFDKLKIVGSLQNKGTRLNQTNKGTYTSSSFKFYCKSIYRIKSLDFIIYDNKLLQVIDVNNYDEYGVRECTLEMSQLHEHQDLAEFIKFLTGDKTV